MSTPPPDQSARQPPQPAQAPAPPTYPAPAAPPPHHQAGGSPTQPPYPGSYGQPAPQYATTPGESKPMRGNPLGLVALIAGGLLLLWQFVFLFLQAGAITIAGAGALGAISALGGVVQGILSLVAVAFGIIGIVQRDKPKVPAAIGAGIGVSGLVGVIVGLLFPLVLAATNS